MFSVLSFSICLLFGFVTGKFSWCFRTASDVYCGVNGSGSVSIPSCRDGVRTGVVRSTVCIDGGGFEISSYSGPAGVVTDATSMERFEAG